MLKIARAKKTVTTSNLDNYPRLLNCKNGTVDLEMGAIKPHDRTDRLTKIVVSEYDPDAATPLK
jgi:putative DNA primase/helicase